jgi:hypothetical protein
MLRDNTANVTPSQIIDPVDKTTIIDKKGKIEKCLIKHFGDIIGWSLFKIIYGYEQNCKRVNDDITTEF